MLANLFVKGLCYVHKTTFMQTLIVPLQVIKFTEMLLLTPLAKWQFLVAILRLIFFSRPTQKVSKIQIYVAMYIFTKPAVDINL